MKVVAADLLSSETLLKTHCEAAEKGAGCGHRFRSGGSFLPSTRLPIRRLSEFVDLGNSRELLLYEHDNFKNV